MCYKPNISGSIQTDCTFSAQKIWKLWNMFGLVCMLNLLNNMNEQGKSRIQNTSDLYRLETHTSRTTLFEIHRTFRLCTFWVANLCMCCRNGAGFQIYVSSGKDQSLSRASYWLETLGQCKNPEVLPRSTSARKMRYSQGHSDLWRLCASAVATTKACSWPLCLSHTEAFFFREPVPAVSIQKAVLVCTSPDEEPMQC